ncbi:MAG: hydroxymethylbilane synthase [Actinomycetota bacterium]
MGTRRSALALAQAGEVSERLRALGVDSELVPMTTEGDRGAAPEADGGKGLFVGDIVRALQDGEIDLAVHSAKDLPAEDPEGVIVAAVPERASPFDALVSRDPEPAEGARVGTSSLRRRGQFARSFPRLQAVDIRGNVDTRLTKMREGEVDGLLLAVAGLVRLGVEPEHVRELSADDMMPAPGQGALAVQARAVQAGAVQAGAVQAGAADRARELIARIDDERSHAAFDAERTLVARLGGGCSLPLGAYAEDTNGSIRLIAAVFEADGSSFIRAEASARLPADAAGFVADALLAGGARRILGEFG